MPMTVVKVDILKNMQQNLRVTLRKADIPEYSWKERREGFEVWHTEYNEGETWILWRTFDPADDAVAQRQGLERIAALLQEHYWVKLDLPGLYTVVNRPTLRVLYGLFWLK